MSTLQNVTAKFLYAAEGNFLRSNPDGKASNNLEHLIDFDWLKP